MKHLINVNHTVRVRLNDVGRAIVKQHTDDLNAELRSRGAAYVVPGMTVTEDAEGWSRWQLWRLMETFGPHIGIGLPTPFDGNVVEIDTGAPKQRA